MSTNSELTTLVDDNIRNKTPKVLKDEHADVEQAIVDELCPDVYNDTQSTTNLITKANTNFNYNLNIWKSGRTVFITGIIRNSTFGNLTAQDIASGLTGEFEPLATTYFTAWDNSTTNRMNISFHTDGKIKLISSLNTQNDFTINAHYPTAE